jgi:hypothetical protein
MDKYAQRGLNMHKLILSIIAVACLQIGFITYVTSDKTADNAALYKVSTGSPSIIPAADDEGIEVASLDEDPFFRRDDGEFRIVRTARYVKADYAIRRKNNRTARKTRIQPEPFEPEQIIITYAVQKPYKFVEREPYRNVTTDSNSIVNKSEIAEQPVIKSQKSDGNPILNIIKKPYNWIKALGSKLK